MGLSKSPYRMIALDMDGTLLTDDKRISIENRKWIDAARAAGVKVVISTGRAIHSVMPFVKELQLDTPVVTVNGSEVWRDPQTLHSRVLMDTDLVLELYRLALECSTHYWGISVQGMFNKHNWVQDIRSMNWLKFGCVVPDTAARQKLITHLESWGTLELSNSDPQNLEINPKSVSKATGLMQVCELLGFQMSEVVAMGDSYNDMTMIRSAGLGVAMGNAQDGVKEAADLVTVTNEEDGVAKIIREVVLNQL